MKRGLILTNAYYTSEAFERQTSRLRGEFASLGVNVDVRRNDSYAMCVDGGKIAGGLGSYDFAVYLDKDAYIAQMLERSGMRLFNRAAAVAVCDDKMLTHIALAGSGLAMPKTVPGLLCYSARETVSGASVDNIEKQFGYPLIVKDSRNSLGEGVYKIDDRAKLSAVMDKLKTRPHIFQEYIGSSFGRDLRVIVVGGNAVGGMLRRAPGFRANVSAGGKGEAFALSRQQAEAAERAAKALELDFAGVDFLFGGDSGLILSEVNSNALFIEFEKVTGINVAKAYAEHIFCTMYK